MTKTELRQNIGKIIAKDNKDYIWLFKLIEVPKGDKDLVVTQGMDVFPVPRTYSKDLYGMWEEHNKEYSFNTPFEENYQPHITRLPTKEEINLYRKYTRELRLLGTNKTNFGTK
jgi:hypothetical protein